MSILVIRAHKRFAVRGNARLGRPGRRRAPGLVIELSLDGARISGVPSCGYAPGDATCLAIDGWEPMACEVRWAGEATIGLRFVQPLHIGALERLIHLCRSEEPARAYGT